MPHAAARVPDGVGSTPQHNLRLYNKMVLCPGVCSPADLNHLLIEALSKLSNSIEFTYLDTRMPHVMV